jgi:superfamily II DNA or RNA helicase
MKLDNIDNLPDYLHAFRDEITARVQAEAPPLHEPTRDASDPKLEEATRKPYPVQAHAITAIVKTLKERPGVYVCGEMGTGKTLISALASWLLFPHGRTLVMCPGHLTEKWKRELQTTIPECQVWIIRDIADAARAISEPKTGRPQFWVMSKETGKLGYYSKPAARTVAGQTARGNVAVQQRGSMKPTRRDLYDRSHTARRAIGDTQQGITRTVFADGKQIIVTTIDVYCPDCGTRLEKSQKTENDLPIRIQLSDLQKKKHLYCPACREKYFERPQDATGHTAPYWNVPEDDAKRMTKEQIADYKKRTKQRYTAMNGADRSKVKKIAIADYFSRKSAKFDLFIADECHELKGSDTAQGNALGTLAARASKVLCLTGTLIGGHSSHLFYLNYRMNPARMKADGFAYGKTNLWVDRYGIRETVTRETVSPDSSNGRSRGSRTGTRTASEEKAGISPALFAEQLLNNAVFIHLEDVACNLPSITEYPTPVDMDSDLRSAYRRLEADIRRVMNEQLARGNKKLLGAFLANLLSYPDKPFDNPAVDLKNGSYAIPEELPQNIEYAKEAELVRIVREARARGRKSLIYVEYTGKRDTCPRIQKLLGEYGIQAGILYANTVDPVKREKWIEDHAPLMDALIVNPACVKTGLDLIQFSTVVYVQTGYSIFTLRQSSRRSWRIGQTAPVEIHYLYYRETMQARAMKLISRKLAASTALEGKLTSEGLQALAGDDEDEAMQLARSLCENEEIEGIETAWKLLNEQHQAQQEREEMKKRKPLDIQDPGTNLAQIIKPEPTTNKEITFVDALTGKPHHTTNLDACTEREIVFTRAGVIAHDPLDVIGTNDAPDMKHLCEAYEEGTPAFEQELNRISHNLMPTWLKDRMPLVYSQENNPDPLVMVKWFTPDSSWTWYVTEYSDKAPDGYPHLAFGLTDGFEQELGCISLDEISSVKGKMGLKVERDLWWKPTPLSQVRKMISGTTKEPEPEPTSPNDYPDNWDDIEASYQEEPARECEPDLLPVPPEDHDPELKALATQAGQIADALEEIAATMPEEDTQAEQPPEKWKPPQLPKAKQTNLAKPKRAPKNNPSHASTEPSNNVTAETTQSPTESKTDPLKTISAQEANIRRLLGRDPTTNKALDPASKVVYLEDRRLKPRRRPPDTRQISLFG